MLEEFLAFKVVIPLVESTEYIKYELMSWTVPYNSTGMTAKLILPSVVAIDTATGTVFTPHRWVGNRPAACRTGGLYKQPRKSCLRGILTNRKDLLAKCPITIGKRKEEAILTEVYPGEYIIETWKTMVSIQCLGQHGSSAELSTGTFHVLVPEGCVVQGDGWTLPGMLRRTVNKTLIARRIKVPSFHLSELIPELTAHRLLDQGGLNPLEVPPPLTLSKLDVPPEIQLPSESQGMIYGIPSLLLEGLAVILVVLLLVKSGKVTCSV